MATQNEHISPSSPSRSDDSQPYSNRYRMLVQVGRDRARRAAPDRPALAGPLAADPREGPGPGTVLARRYQLLDLLGEGGMGSVWRAWNMSLDLDVAVKLVRRTAAVPHASERLLKEARAAARVIHPGAVRVFDFDLTDDGDPFLVMELLSGRTLSRALRESGSLAPLQAVLMILPVLGALRVAHGEGIVHRDVKPANVMLVNEGRRLIPKLIDFGIAAVAPSSWSRTLSAYGMLLGSPSYLAPEQARGGAIVDVRTDVWGASTTLYEMVNGARPFAGADRSSVIQEILSSAPRRPAALDAHPELWQIVERGLEKALDDRWPTVGALGAALAGWALAQGATHDAAGAPLREDWR